jgi:Family of unknown function (DUF7009)
MKLRIKDDSVRFRIAPSEVEVLLREGVLTSRVQFSVRPQRCLSYSLVLDGSLAKATVEFDDGEILARLPREEAERWGSTDAVSLAGEMELNGTSSLLLLIEKDFACLDLSDQENADTYPNPNAGQVC